MSHRAPNRRDVIYPHTKIFGVGVYFAAPRRMRAGLGFFFHPARKRLLHEQAAGVAVSLLGLILVSCAGATTARAAEEQATASHGSSFRYDPEGRRDPFLPLVRNGQPLVPLAGRSTDAASTLPVLHGVLWDPGGASIALINDEEVKVGDTVGDYQVVAIRQDAVVLSNGGEPVVLQINFETPPEFSSGTTTGGEGR